MQDYDFIIIGGGPSGLTVAHLLTKLNAKILVIEREKTLGGCHRVKYVDDYFTHHSPMVYTDASVNFIKLLDEIDYSFYENFTKYKFSLFDIATNTLFKTLTFQELLVLIKETIALLVNNNHLTKVQLKEYLETNKFTAETIDIIDRICRLSDGAGIEKFSVNLFLQLINQNAVYNLYQTKLNNEDGMFKKWETYLKDRFVNIKTSETLLNFDDNNKIIKTDKETYRYSKLIITTPIQTLNEIINNSNTPQNSLTLNKISDTIASFTKHSVYNHYVSVTFHYTTPLELQLIHGFPKSKWGVYFIILSDYMDTSKKSSTLISATASISSIKGYNNKTLDQTENKEEVVQEIFNQLKEYYPKLQNYDKAILNPNNYYDQKEQGWKSLDSSSIDSYNFIPFPTSFENLNNVYFVGTYTGMSYYKPTSIEKAITNSMMFTTKLFPELKKYYTPRRGFFLEDLALIITIILAIVFIIVIFIKK